MYMKVCDLVLISSGQEKADIQKLKKNCYCYRFNYILCKRLMECQLQGIFHLHIARSNSVYEWLHRIVSRKEAVLLQKRLLYYYNA